MAKEASTGPILVDEGPLNGMLMGGTAVIHREAERVPFMVAFFKGELPKEAYAAYLGRLHGVYEALERSAASLKDHPVLGRFYTPELSRLSKLEEDLAYWVGPDWRQQITPTPASKAYADRVIEVAETTSSSFVAHHWLRYLGYVLGQDLLRKLVRKSYGVESEGMAFYDFPDIDDPKAYLLAYHEKMNSMPLSLDDKRAVIEEGYIAFKLQKELTEELAADFGVGDVSAEETERLMDELNAEHP
jgi:heme oxygenase